MIQILFWFKGTLEHFGLHIECTFHNWLSDVSNPETTISYFDLFPISFYLFPLKKKYVWSK